MDEFVKDFVVGKYSVARDPLVCHICNVRVTSRVKLEDHYASHSIRLRWRCVTCAHLESSSQVLSSHATKCRRKCERNQAPPENPPAGSYSGDVVDVASDYAEAGAAEPVVCSQAGSPAALELLSDVTSVVPCISEVSEGSDVEPLDEPVSSNSEPPVPLSGLRGVGPCSETAIDCSGVALPRHASAVPAISAPVAARAASPPWPTDGRSQLTPQQVGRTSDTDATAQHGVPVRGRWSLREMQDLALLEISLARMVPLLPALAMWHSGRSETAIEHIRRTQQYKQIFEDSRERLQSSAADPEVPSIPSTAHQPTYAHCRWVDADLTALAMAEASLPATRTINEDLHRSFPSRSTQAIALFRRDRRYKAALELARESRIVPPSLPPFVAARQSLEPLPMVEAEVRQVLLEAGFTTPGMESVFCCGPLCMADVSEILSLYGVRPRPPQSRRPREVPPASSSSRKVCRQQQFKEHQRL